LKRSGEVNGARGKGPRVAAKKGTFASVDRLSRAVDVARLLQPNIWQGRTGKVKTGGRGTCWASTILGEARPLFSEATALKPSTDTSGLPRTASGFRVWGSSQRKWTAGAEGICPIPESNPVGRDGLDLSSTWNDGMAQGGVPDKGTHRTEIVTAKKKLKKTGRRGGFFFFFYLSTKED